MMLIRAKMALVGEFLEGSSRAKLAHISIYSQRYHGNGPLPLPSNKGSKRERSTRAPFAGTQDYRNTAPRAQS